MLERLILLRHGEAAPAAAPGADLDRRLTDAGRAAARDAGRVLSREGVTPDVVLVSPAVRTRQTWAAARTAWSPPPPGREARGLYDEPPAQLLRLAEAAGGACVMLVAHNPGLQVLAADLALGDPRLMPGFPPGALAVLEHGAAAGPGWRLTLFHTPEAVAA